MTTDNMLQTYVKNMPELTPDIIKKYICDKATDQEIYFFIQLCKAQNLNPFLREVYLIKFGTAPATMVVGKETFTKRADRLPQYNGNKAGLIIVTGQQISYREGAFIQKGETLLGGWAEVFRKDRDHSTRIEVTLSEYEGRKQDGELNQQWKTKPATMIRKVALVQGLREAFPDEFASMYSEEEEVTAVPQQDQEEKRIPIAMPISKVVEEQKPNQSTEETPKEPMTGDSTQPQHGALFAILKKLGIEDEMSKHEKVSKILGIDHVIASMKELTRKQASDAIALLGSELNKAER